MIHLLIDSVIINEQMTLESVSKSLGSWRLLIGVRVVHVIHQYPFVEVLHLRLNGINLGRRILACLEESLHRLRDQGVHGNKTSILRHTLLLAMAGLLRMRLH